MSDKNLLKSINDIDDDLVFEAEQWKPRKARKLKIAVFAAAAAAAALFAFTGFENSFNGDGKNYLKITNDDNVVLHSFYYNLKTWDITIPEEYRTTDRWGYPHCFKRLTGTLPSEIFEQFEVSPLMNDNFSENIEFQPINEYDVYSSNGEYEGKEIDYGYPILDVSDIEVSFHYHLYDKNLQKTIGLKATYPISDEYNIGGSVGVGDDSDYDIIKLKDGSKCYVDAMGAVFSYEGVLYTLNSYYVDEDYDKLTVGTTKQILKDLGVY